MSVLRRGDTGAAVAEVRARLADLGLCTWPSEATDLFDDELDRAVRTFQQERGITVDGVVGVQTLRRLDEARWRLGDRVLWFNPTHLMAGDDVAELQRRLSTLGFLADRPDGLFGAHTDEALREFQKNVGVTSDGTCGPETFRAFDRLVRTVSGGNATTLREQVRLSALQTGVADKVVVIDPGDDIGEDICHAVGVRVEGRLAALGTQVLLTRPPGEAAADDRARAQFANDVGADIVLSLHVSEAASPRPNGLVTFYFGDPFGGLHSPAGRLLAGFVQEDVQARTDLLDCYTHPRTWDLLRLTRMPAVRVELGYLSNDADARRLNSAAFQDVLAEGLASAITRFCSPH